MQADLTARPYLAIYVVWHPSCDSGGDVADSLHRHFRRDLFTNVAGGAGIDVMRRFAPPPGGRVPLAIDEQDADLTAVVVLLDDNLVSDHDYRGYVESLAVAANRSNFSTLVLPVAIDRRALDVGGELAANELVRWDHWDALDASARHRRLVAELTHQFCRMLRTRLASLDNPGVGADLLGAYLQPVRMFLSHSKHDRFGALITQAVHDQLRDTGDLATFFDVVNIPAGLPFDKVLLYFVNVSAMLAVHTDSYGSRTWCRREILEAKRHGVPIVVANCIDDFEERGFPYMSNVPVVRLEPRDPPDRDRIGVVVARLLDEVLKDFLWKCRIRLPRSRARHVTFLPRQPELVALVTMAAGRPEGAGGLIVYPDPPLGAEETALFESVSSGIVLRSFTEWQAEATA